MNEITILSTACGAIFMPGFFRCLNKNGERNIRIIGCDAANVPYMKNLIDAYYIVPRYNDSHYIDIIISICEEEHVNIVFPHISMELPFFHERIKDFENKGIKVAISSNSSLSIANNKYLLYDYLSKQGIMVPEFYKVTCKEDLISFSTLLGYPDKDVCVKITDGSGSRGVRIITNKYNPSEIFIHEKPSSLFTTLDNMCEIIENFKGTPTLLLMKALPGCEYTVDLLAEKGKVLIIAGRRNTVSSMSIAQESVVEYNDEAYKLCNVIVEKLMLDGNIGFDFMMDENDKPVLTDLNPRITASIILYLAAGINFPYLRVKQLLNETMPKLKVKYGVKLVRKYDDVLLDAEDRIICEQ